MKRIEFISPEEYRKLFVKAKDKKMKLVLMLAFGSGMRISEIIGLKSRISDCCRTPVKMEKELIGNRNFKRYFCTKCNKALEFGNLRYAGNDWQIPPLSPLKVDLVKHQIRIDNAKGNKWRVTVTPPTLTEEYIKLLPLKQDDGKPYPMRTIQYQFGVLAFEALGKKMSVHILRHGFGNYQANILKIPLAQVQALMGHSRLDTTGIYTKVNPEEAISSVWKEMNKGI